MSKDKLLSLYSPNEIYLKFLELDEFPKKNISSPFSSDTNPSFKLYENGTFKCFSSGLQGDIFCFVAELNKLDCKRDFPQIMQLICAKLNLSLEKEDPFPKKTTKETEKKRKYFSKQSATSHGSSS